MRSTFLETPVIRNPARESHVPLQESATVSRVGASVVEKSSVAFPALPSSVQHTVVLGFVSIPSVGLSELV